MIRRHAHERPRVSPLGGVRFGAPGKWQRRNQPAGGRTATRLIADSAHHSAPFARGLANALLGRRTCEPIRLRALPGCLDGIRGNRRVAVGLPMIDFHDADPAGSRGRLASKCRMAAPDRDRCRVHRVAASACPPAQNSRRPPDDEAAPHAVGRINRAGYRHAGQSSPTMSRFAFGPPLHMEHSCRRTSTCHG